MSFLVIASETVENESAAINPYVVGLITLVILTSLMLGMLSFGKGREHS